MGSVKERGLQSWNSELGKSEKMPLRSWHFSWALKINRQVGQLLLSIFLLNCLFLYLYTTHEVSGFSMSLLTEFRFFYVFVCLAQCLTWDRVLGISVSVIIYKMGTNTTCLNRVFLRIQSNDVSECSALVQCVNLTWVWWQVTASEPSRPSQVGDCFPGDVLRRALQNWWRDRRMLPVSQAPGTLFSAFLSIWFSFLFKNVFICFNWTIITILWWFLPYINMNWP